MSDSCSIASTLAPAQLTSVTIDHANIHCKVLVLGYQDEETSSACHGHVA